MMPLRLALLLPLTLLGACGDAEPTDPGGLTRGEAQELNDAAAMLDADAVDANALPPSKEAP